MFFVDSVGTVRRMRVFQESLVIAVGVLRKFELKKFSLKTRELVWWNCVLLLFSYCCYTSENKSIVAAWYGVVRKRPNVRCMVTVEDNVCDQMANKRSIKWEIRL